MTIHGKLVPIDLKPATPTVLTADLLASQLKAIGLTCMQTELSKLTGYIEEVKNTLPDPLHGAQAWSIMTPGTPSSSSPAADEATLPEFESATGLVTSSTGNWVPGPTALGYRTYLEYIQVLPHFEWLAANRKPWFGKGPTTRNFSGKDMTLEAIKTQFADVGAAMSGQLSKGLDKSDTESALSNAIGPSLLPNQKNYGGRGSKTLFLVDNFNPNTGNAEGIGVLTVSWLLTIENYKTKKGPVPLKHDFTLEMTVWAIEYGSVSNMMADYHAAQSQFATAAIDQLREDPFAIIPPLQTSVKIFEKHPPANMDTFNNSIPLNADTNKASVLVLYAPNLQNIGSLDNTSSKASSRYSKAVSTGFTFSSTQSLSLTASIEVSVLIVKASVSVGFSLSFTEQWSKLTTETIMVNVPANQKAFVYQGILLASVLTYDPTQGKGVYSFGEVAQALSPVLVTSEKPIMGAVSFPH